MPALSRRLFAPVVSRVLATFIAFATLSLGVAAFAQETEPEPDDAPKKRPAISRILPEKTLLYIRVPDPQATIADMKETSTGRMLADPKLAPIVDDLYGVVGEMYAQVEERVGASFEEIQKIPTGEMVIAVCDLGEGEPGAAGFLDVRSNPVVGDRVVETIERLMINDGAVRDTFQMGDDELVTLETLGTGLDDIEAPIRPARSVSWFKKDGLLVMTTRPEMARVIHAFWTGEPKDDEGEPFKRLSDSRKFVTVYDKIKGEQSGDPDILAFADPIQWVRVAMRGNFAAMAVLGFFPTLGLDGIQGIGASIDFSGGDGEYEDVQHLYVLVDKPRTGVTKALALRDGDLMPEAWVPKDCYAYSSLLVDPDIAYAEIEKMYDQVYSKGAFAEWTKENFDDRLGVDVRTELVGGLEGRVTFAYWNEPPARFNSQAQAIAFRLRDPKAFEQTLDAIFAKTTPPDLEKRKIGEHAYWYLGENRPPGRGRRQAQQQAEAAAEAERAAREGQEPRGLDDFEQFESQRDEGGDEPAPGEGPGGDDDGPRMNMRTTQNLIAIVGDNVIYCDSEAYLRKILETYKGAPALQDDLDLKLVAAQAATLPGGDKPAFFNFMRPEAQMRQAYELLQGDDVKGWTKSGAEGFAPFGSLNRVLEETEFPSFDEFEKYFAPAGGIVVDEENGWHYLGFSLKAKSN